MAADALARTALRAALILPVFLAAPAAYSCSPYQWLTVEQISDAPQQYVGKTVLTWGEFHLRGEPRYFIEGVLVGSTGARVRMMGPAFDWLPPTGAEIEAWGVLRQDSHGIFLDFYNGRLRGSTGRRPYLMPVLKQGETATLVGKLRQVGSMPFVHWVMETEDRKTIEVLAFPTGFQPQAGLIVEASGAVRVGGIPPFVAGLRIVKLRILPGIGPLPFGG